MVGKKEEGWNFMTFKLLSKPLYDSIMKWEIFFPLILKNQLQGLTKKTEFFLRTIITILWEEWLEKKQEMPEVEEVYQKVNNCKILQVWKNTKAVFGHDRYILFRCKEDVVQLVHFVHAETGMPQVSVCFWGSFKLMGP